MTNMLPNTYVRAVGRGLVTAMVVAALALGVGCGRPDEARCKEVCAHVEGLEGRKLPRCVKLCLAHGSEQRAGCLLEAKTVDEAGACRGK